MKELKSNEDGHIQKIESLMENMKSSLANETDKYVHPIFSVVQNMKIRILIGIQESMKEFKRDTGKTKQKELRDQ